MSNIPSHIHSARALHEHLKYENEKLAQERKVQNSILSMNNLQQKTNDFLKHSHELQDLHIKSSNNQVLLISTLIEEQRKLRTEQIANAVAAKRSSDSQFWFNAYVVTITTLGFIIQLYQAMIDQK